MNIMMEQAPVPPPLPPRSRLRAELGKSAPNRSSSPTIIHHRRSSSAQMIHAPKAAPPRSNLPRALFTGNKPLPPPLPIRTQVSRGTSSTYRSALPQPRVSKPSTRILSPQGTVTTPINVPPDSICTTPIKFQPNSTPTALTSRKFSLPRGFFAKSPTQIPSSSNTQPTSIMQEYASPEDQGASNPTKSIPVTPISRNFSIRRTISKALSTPKQSLSKSAPTTPILQEFVSTEAVPNPHQSMPTQKLAQKKKAPMQLYEALPEPPLRSPIDKFGDLVEVRPTPRVVSSDDPNEYLRNLEIEYADISQTRPNMAPGTRRFLAGLQSDCVSALNSSDYPHRDLCMVALRLSKNMYPLEQMLWKDDLLVDRIEEYQIFRFKNYLIGMGGSIPGTQQAAIGYFSDLSAKKFEYNGVIWEHMLSKIQQEMSELRKWEKAASAPNASPKPITRYMLCLQEAGVQCDDLEWRWIFGPLAEYGQYLKPENKRDAWIILPGGEKYVRVMTIVQLVAAGLWMDIARILIRNWHDLPKIVPLRIRSQIENFRAELKIFQHLHFKEIKEEWCPNKRRYVATSYQLQDWIRASGTMNAMEMLQDEKSEIETGTVGTWHEKTGEREATLLTARTIWESLYAELRHADQEVDAATRRLEAKKEAYQAMTDSLLELNFGNYT